MGEREAQMANSQNLEAEIAQLQAQLQQTQFQLQHAHAVIEAMESSKFWKLRSQWFGFKKQISGTVNKVRALMKPAPAPDAVPQTKLAYFETDPSGAYLLGMTSAEEQAYVYQYGAKNYSGVGEIVELGCFLGSLSIPMAKGVLDNPKLANKAGRIHAYDIFYWDEYIVQMFEGDPLGEKFKEGDSFLPEYEERISEVRSCIQIYPGDLTQIGWKGGAIEFLLVDAMKSWELTDSIIKNFFPSLVPGVSLIQHQDYAYFWTTWIHLSMYRLREYFTPLYHVPSSSVIFRYDREIPQDLIDRPYLPSEFTKDEIEQAFDYSLKLVPPEMRPNIAASKVAAYFQINDFSQARLTIERFKQNGIYSATSDFSQIEQILEQHGG